MRISDWSSDVCSSDLFGLPTLHDRLAAVLRPAPVDAPVQQVGGRTQLRLGGGVGVEVAACHERADDQQRGVDHRQLAAPHARAGVAVQEVRSEEHTSELQSLMRISYAVFCWNKTTVNN